MPRNQLSKTVFESSLVDQVERYTNAENRAVVSRQPQQDELIHNLVTAQKQNWTIEKKEKTKKTKSCKSEEIIEASKNTEEEKISTR